MVRLKVGDVFEIHTPRGKAYIQYVSNDEVIGELIRVLPGVYDNLPDNIKEIASGKEEFFIHFPLKAALKQKILKRVSNFDLPKNFKIPTKFRTEVTDNEGNIIGWHIVDYDTLKRETVSKLSEEQTKLSPWGTWNDTLLIERISQGWTLKEWGI